jgi:hypothetical protein
MLGKNFNVKRFELYLFVSVCGGVDGGLNHIDFLGTKRMSLIDATSCHDSVRASRDTCERSPATTTPRTSLNRCFANTLHAHSTEAYTALLSYTCHIRFIVEFPEDLKNVLEVRACGWPLCLVGRCANNLVHVCCACRTA